MPTAWKSWKPVSLAEAHVRTQTTSSSAHFEMQSSIALHEGLASQAWISLQHFAFVHVSHAGLSETFARCEQSPLASFAASFGALASPLDEPPELLEPPLLEPPLLDPPPSPGTVEPPLEDDEPSGGTKSGGGFDAHANTTPARPRPATT